MSATSGHPAQPDNLAVDRAVGMLQTCAALLNVQADALLRRPTRAERAALKRILSGVLADVETVRVSIKE